MTSGWTPARIRLAALVLFLTGSALQATANVYSRLADLREAGQQPAGWSIALDEASSMVAWCICLVVIWQLVRLARPPRLSWLATITAHAAATVPVSLLHVGLMVMLREAGHALIGSEYSFTSDWNASLLYEYRKDAMSYFLLALSCAGVQWFTRSTSDDGEAAEEFLTIGEGTRVHRLRIAEIDWAEAAGNYVTLHLGERELLHRTTLAALETLLAPHGFARIHRSRLVRSEAIRTIENTPSGDFTVTLTGGTRLRGSRRFREGLPG